MKFKFLILSFAVFISVIFSQFVFVGSSVAGKCYRDPITKKCSDGDGGWR